MPSAVIRPSGAAAATVFQAAARPPACVCWGCPESHMVAARAPAAAGAARQPRVLRYRYHQRHCLATAVPVGSWRCYCWNRRVRPSPVHESRAARRKRRARGVHGVPSSTAGGGRLEGGVTSPTDAVRLTPGAYLPSLSSVASLHSAAIDPVGLAARRPGRSYCQRHRYGAVGPPSTGHWPAAPLGHAAAAAVIGRQKCRRRSAEPRATLAPN